MHGVLFILLSSLDYRSLPSVSSRAYFIEATYTVFPAAVAAIFADQLLQVVVFIVHALAAGRGKDIAISSLTAQERRMSILDMLSSLI